MPAPVILVTGANGQLGSAIKALADGFPQYHFLFPGHEALPVHQPEQLQQYFKKNLPAFCINCAAYTAVDRAETDRETAMQVNGVATGLLAAVCKSFNTRLIHISTDYVFDGTGSAPYKEADTAHPVNYYGATKLEGEQACFRSNSEAVVIRTSWVYSEFGNNFVKTMLRLMKEKGSLNVVNDQLGSPTYALDLAGMLLTIISATWLGNQQWMPGIYHYSNDGVISWYDFAVAIRNLIQSPCEVHPVPTIMFPTPAKRPAYSVMDKQKIQSAYHVQLRDWQTSLATCIARLQS